MVKRGVSYVSNKKQIRKKLDRPKSMICQICTKDKKMTEYYVSSSVFHAGTGRVPYCKDCLKGMSMDANGNIDLNKFKAVLEQIDKPYIHDVVQVSFDEAQGVKGGKGDVVGIYFKNINSLHQYKFLTWVDSNFGDNDKDKKMSIVDIAASFEITDEIIDKWGVGYTNEEYFFFEKKWEKLIDNYGQKTSFHVEALITYIRFRVKEEMATAAGLIREAKDWGALAKDAATEAKINVRQLSKADLSGGIELLPQLFEAVESKIGIIPILPKLKEQPYDDVDLIIWSIINYNRGLEGKPRVKYRDIWDFYDNMLEEYFKQRGFTPKRIAEEKRKRNNVFVDLEEVYQEPEYDEDDG